LILPHQHYFGTLDSNFMDEKHIFRIVDLTKLVNQIFQRV